VAVLSTDILYPFRFKLHNSLVAEEYTEQFLDRNDHCSHSPITLCLGFMATLAQRNNSAAGYDLDEYDSCNPR
jgi:hypothetical protein